MSAGGQYYAVKISTRGYYGARAFGNDRGVAYAGAVAMSCGGRCAVVIREGRTGKRFSLEEMAKIHASPNTDSATEKL